MAVRDLRTLAMGTALGLACLGAFADVLANDFVSFDDPQYILDNEPVRLGLTWEGVRWAFTHAYSDNWHPLTWVSHMIDVSLFGVDPRGHHATSVLLHAANAIVLFVLLLRTTSRRWPSLLAAALFALHPLRVESVAWAAERKDVLSGLFCLLTLVVYVETVRRPTRARRMGVALCFALGLLAKPMLVTLPLLLLLFDYWPLGRSRSLMAPARLWIEKLPLFGLAFASGLVTLWAQSRGSTLQTLEAIPLADRLQNAVVAIGIYLRQSLWPVDLAFFYPHPALVEVDLSAPLAVQAVLCAALVVAVTFVALWRSPSHPFLATGWLWFSISLAPVIGVVQVGAQAHADRYTYLPSIGLAIALAFGLDAVVRRSVARFPGSHRTIERAAAALALTAILALGVLTFGQVGVWRSSERLYQHALEVSEGNYIAAFNLGALAGGSGAHTGAIAFYRMALAMRPDYAPAHSNLGVSLGQLGHDEEAAVHFREALRLDPRLTQAAINLGSHHAERGEIERARTLYRDAIRARPDLALPREVLGELEQRRGRLDDAVDWYGSALERRPGSANLHAKIAGALDARGDQAQAIAHYRSALAIEPSLLAASNALARLLATALDPALRDGPAAVAYALAANRATDHRNPTFLLTLALAHAAAGDLAEARRQRDRAVGFAPAERRDQIRATFETHFGVAEDS